MRHIENQEILAPHWELSADPKTFSRFNPFAEPKRYCDFRVSESIIDGLYISSPGNFQRRKVVENASFSKCKLYASFEGVEFHNVELSGIQTGRNPCFFFGCVFSHTKINGNCGQFIFDWMVSPGNRTKSSAWVDFIRSYYADKDWALDISEARCSCLEIKGAIPGERIKINGVDQFYISSTSARSEDWRSVDGIEGSLTKMKIESLQNSPWEQNIICAEPRSKFYKEELLILNRLFDLGFIYTKPDN